MVEPIPNRPRVTGVVNDQRALGEIVELRRVERRGARRIGQQRLQRDEIEAAGVDEASFLRHEKAWYDGSIRGMDEQLKRAVDRLDRDRHVT